MTTKQLEQELIKNTKGLPKEVLEEILDFVKLIRQKRDKVPVDNIKGELTSLNDSQASHLEMEFKDYKELYPGE